MRRQTISGQVSAEPDRVARLAPLTLPVRFTASDAGADGQVRSIDICPERVVVRRSVRGMAIRCNIPHQAFRGVSLRFVAAGGCTIALEHTDPALTIVLAEGGDEDLMLTAWEQWSQALSLPLMLGNENGALPLTECEVSPSRPSPRRRKQNALRARRPTFLLRRKVGAVARALPVYDGREIIARS